MFSSPGGMLATAAGFPTTACRLRSIKTRSACSPSSEEWRSSSRARASKIAVACPPFVSGRTIDSQAPPLVKWISSRSRCGFARMPWMTAAADFFCPRKISAPVGSRRTTATRSPRDWRRLRTVSFAAAEDGSFSTSGAAATASINVSHAETVLLMLSAPVFAESACVCSTCDSMASRLRSANRNETSASGISPAAVSAMMMRPRKPICSRRRGLGISPILSCERISSPWYRRNGNVVVSRLGGGDFIALSGAIHRDLTTSRIRELNLTITTRHAVEKELV